MTFSYDASAATTRDKLRFLIGDTDTVTAAKQIFTDEELDMMLSECSSDLYKTASACMMAVASSQSRLAAACAIGGHDFSIDRKAVAFQCREQAKEFLKQSTEKPAAVEVAWEDKDLSELKSYGRDEFDYETDLDELNN